MIKKYIPNIFTFLNMLLGLMAILLLVHAEHDHKIIIVTVLILTGSVADFFDGFFARKFDVVTNFGKQLDSFADIITFGIAPIALLNHICSCNYKVLAIVASMAYLSAGAYRLARYNLGEFKSHFAGMPITIAGVLLTLYSASYSLWAQSVHDLKSSTVTLLFVILLVMLMVSRKKIKRILK